VEHAEDANGIVEVVETKGIDSEEVDLHDIATTNQNL
jgi:hypothetical protein